MTRTSLISAAMLLAGCNGPAGQTSASESGGSTGGATTSEGSSGEPTTGGGEPAPVTAVWEDDALVLLRGGEPLLRFPGDGFQLGAVSMLDDKSSYDPVWLEPEQWLTVTSAEVTSAQAPVDVRLVFAGGAAARLKVEEAAPGRFAASLVPEMGGPTIAYLRLNPQVDAQEGFYGLGEYFDGPEHRGRVRAMQIEFDAQVESQYNEAHVPVPLVIGTRGWGLFVEDPHPATFDVAAAADDRVQATFGTGADSSAGLKFHLYGADHPLDITRHYYATTGQPLLPALWALGPWIWRDENDDQAQVEDDAAKIRSLDLATSAMWIDRPYEATVNTFVWDAARFPDPAAMLQTLRGLGLRLALWHAPYLDDAPETAALRQEAKDAGYFPPTVGLLTSSWEEPIDFTNPAAMAWWQDHVRSYTDLGVEGFKLDYAEDVTVGISGARTPWQFFDGSTERTMHKLYATWYHRAYAELLPQTGGFLLCRAGTYGDQTRVSVIWPGDLDANMAKHREKVDDGGDSYVAVGGLPAAVSASLSLGPSGFPFFASDTGGYRHSPPDRETFTRWFEFTALTPVMQVGTSTNDVPWEFTADNGFDEEMLGWYRRYARLHMRLMPYVWTYAQRLKDDGRPLQRPLGLAYPELGAHPADVYVLGDDLLVAPVVERGATSRAVQFPPGRWRDWWTGELVEGPGEKTVAAPLDTLPLYLREGGLVPMLRPTIDTLAPTTDETVESYDGAPGPLYVRVHAGASGEFVVFDGTRVALGQKAAGYDLTVEPGEKFAVGAVFEVIGVASPAQVSEGDKGLTKAASPAALEMAATGWAWAPDVGGTLWIKLAGGAHTVTVE